MRYLRCGVCNKVISTTVFEDIEYDRSKEAPEFPHHAVLAMGQHVVKKLVCSKECEDVVKREFEEKHGLKDTPKIEQQLQTLEMDAKCNVCDTKWATKYVMEVLKFGGYEEKYVCCSKECSDAAKLFFAKKHGLLTGPKKENLKYEAIRFFIQQFLPETVPDTVAEKLFDVWKTGFETTGGHGDGWPVGDVEGVYLMCRAYLIEVQDPIIIEVGCGVGYSASITAGALALRDDKGRVISFDDDYKYMGIARRNIEKLPWADRIELIHIKNIVDMKELNAPADILFNDADDDVRPLVIPAAVKYGAIKDTTEVYLHDIVRPAEKKMCERWKAELSKKGYLLDWRIVVQQGMKLAGISIKKKEE